MKIKIAHKRRLVIPVSMTKVYHATVHLNMYDNNSREWVGEIDEFEISLVVGKSLEEVIDHLANLVVFCSQ